MANVTVDIQARVVGYEQSIKTLQASLTKLDPGSEMGKSIAKAMEQAQAQVKALSKNMFPKASSDSQIDSIIEKANRAGEAIQHVASMLQNVQVSDLNLGSFGGDIETFKNQIGSLQAELDSKLTAGILKAIGESEQLKNVFNSLGTDLSKATSATLFDDLSKGAQKAANDVVELEKRLERTENSINNYQAVDSALKSSKLGTLEGRTALDDELKNITNSYNAVFESLKMTITNGLNNLKTDTQLDTNGLIDTFFSDLTPQNVQQHIQDLFSTLSAQGIFDENEKRKFYEAIFGGNGEYNTNNINLLTKSIGLDKAYEQYKVQLREFYQKIVNDIDGKDQAQINRLINENQLDKAVNVTIKALDSAYNKLYNSIKQNQEKLNSALGDKQSIVLQLNTAEQNRNNFSSAEQELRQAIETISQENKDLREQIAQLREQLNQKLVGETGKIRQTGATENHNIGQGMRDSLQLSEAYKEQLAEISTKEQALGKLQGVVQRWFSVYAAIRMVRQAINSVISTIQELDSTITEIAIVTNMDQSELWDQMPKYTQLAREYAASISGVYQVSQLYYQQGLQTADVMALTEQTLKMARISGLDYAQATDYMTNAVRSFKMEMSDAQTVVDVYSSIAAASATSVTELASAMSKTASSAEAVGSSFQNTTAMMAVMIEATRESAENIGSAMKSIISRYGEMTSDPSKLTDSEGQEMSLNRVDTALQTVGISIHNAAGEFRNFDDVIMELAEKWNTIDTNTQRYIATIMAGNRQQSRFLALVSSYDRLKELSAEAADSENASQLQFLKTLDSVEAKTQQFQTSIQALYVNSGIEDLYKGILDWANVAITGLDQLSDRFGSLAVIGKISSIFVTLSTLVTNIFNVIKMSFSNMRAKITAEGTIAATEEILQAQTTGNKKVEIARETEEQITQITREEAEKRKGQAEQDLLELKKQQTSKTKMRTTAGMIASVGGLMMSTAAASIDVNKDRNKKAILTGLGGVFSGVGTGLMIGGMPGAILGALTALPSVIEAIGIASESTEERIQRLSDAITKTSNTKLQMKDELKTLTSYKEKFDELSAAQFNSAEAKQEFIKLQNDIAASYPELIAGMDAEGNYVVDMTASYRELAAAKASAYRESFTANLGAELTGLHDLSYILKTVYNKNPLIESGMNWGAALLGRISDDGSNLQDYIINTVQGNKTEVKVSTLRDLLENNAAEGLITKTQHEVDMGGGFTTTQTFESVSETNAQLVNTVLSDLINLLDVANQNNENLTFSEAQKRLARQHNDDTLYQMIVSNINSSVGEYLATAVPAASFQNSLIQNKINSSNAEYIKILQAESESLGNGYAANNLQQYAIQQQLNSGLKKYLDDNRHRIDDKEQYKDEKGNKHDVDEAYLIQEFYKGTDKEAAKDIFYYQEQLSQLMTQGINAKANAIYEELGQYTEKQINESNLTNEAKTLLTGALEEQYKDIYTNYAKWYEKSASLFDTITDFSALFGPKYLAQIQSNYQKIIDGAGSLDFKSDRLEALDNIYKSVAEAGLTSEQQNSVLQKVMSGDLFSITGIYNLIDELGSIEGIDFEGSDIKDKILKFKDFITVNLNTEINSALASYSDGLQSLSDALNKASKGMNLKDAVKMADELGLTLADFNQIGNKFYLQDLTLLKDQYFKHNSEEETEIKKQIDKQKKEYQQFENGLIIDIGTPDLNEYLSLTDESSRRAYYERYADLFSQLQDGNGSPLNSFEVFDNYVKWFKEHPNTYVQDIMQKNLDAAAAESPTQTEFDLNKIFEEAGNDYQQVNKIIDKTYADLLQQSGFDVNTLKNDIQKYLTAEHGDQSFSEFTANAAYTLLDGTINAAEEAVNYLLASTAISQGNLDSLLDLIFGKEGAEGAIKVDRNEIKNQIARGETDKLPEELQKYSALIQDTFRSVRETTVNALISSIGDGSTQIKVTDLNKGLLEQLQNKGWIEEGELETGKYVTIAAEQLAKDANAFQTYIAETFKTTDEQIQALAKYHKNQYANNEISSLSKVLESQGTIAYEDILKYFAQNKNVDLTTNASNIPAYMSAIGLGFNSVGDVIITNYTSWINDLNWTYDQLAAKGTATQAELNSLQAKIVTATAAQETAISSAITDVLKDPSTVTATAIESLANSLDTTYDYVASFFTDNNNGTYNFNITNLKQLLDNARNTLSQATLSALNKSVSTIVDNYTKSTSDAISYSKSGTTSLKEMEDFVKNYNELLGESITTDEAFAYDSELQSWLLNSDLMLKYAQARAQQLGLIDADLETYINDLLKSDVANQIDKSLAGFIDGSEKETQDLTDALTNYYKNFYEKQKQSAINNEKALKIEANKASREAAKVSHQNDEIRINGRTFYNRTADNRGTIADSANVPIISDQEIKEIEQTVEAKYNEIIRQAVEEQKAQLKAGGSNAVEIYKIFNPDATEEELAKIYSAAFDNWSSVVKQLSEVTQGSFVTGHLRDILDELNMLDGENVVNSSFDMVAVYRNIYSQMAKTNGATISGLNDVYAELLTAEDRQNVDIVDMLKNASGMSYDSLGKLLARYNITLEQVLQNEATAAQFGLERTGFGQVRLTNWDAFAKSVFNTDDLKALYNNPDYISAYHSYVDGLITMNETAEDIIKAGVEKELTSLGKIKRGDTLNFSYLDRAFNDMLEQRYDQFTTNNVKNLGNRVEVPPEVMNKAFGKFDWFEPLQEGDYSTLFGRTFTGKQFEGIEDNIGISIAQIDEAGNAITDVQEYLQTLINDSIRIFGGVNEGFIHALDKQQRNLILDIRKYSAALDDDTIWNNQDEITQAVHEAEELPKKIASYKDQLAMFGATFENGILDISEDADLINIASVFQAMINDSGLQLTDTTRAAFEDSIQQIISTYTTAITKGIEGGLTNVEANDLRMQAADLGITNINFEQTTKGLQLSQKSAIELYQAMAKVDGLQGKILFDKLADQLSKTNENFASTEALLNHMVDLSTKLAKVDGKVPDSRRAEYEAELAIAKEIVAVRSTQKDESFNFMSNKIPEGQNNPLNYAKNWTQAIKAINDAYKVKNTKNRGEGQTTTGYMAYENFYNIINEINNMAGIMGKPITVGKTIEDGALTLDGSLESASNLIIKGIESLTAVDTGEMMVNIGGLGISLAKGGKELKSGIDDGIDAIADAQISALDGTIAMLELIVAMESLGDVAGEDMEIKLPDIVVDGEFTEQWNTSLKNLQDYYENHTEFQKVANGIVIDNKKFMDWMKRDASDWDDADAAFLSALYKAAESTNWNLDKVADSLQGFLSSSGIEKFNKTFSLTLNDISYVVSHGVVIEVADWTNENTKAVLQEYMKKSGKSEEEARADILTALESYSKGEGTTGDVTIEEVLRVKHSTLIQHDKKGSYVEDSKGNKYYEDTDEYKEIVNKAVMSDMKDITSGENVTIKDQVIETDYGIKTKIHMKGTLQTDKSMKWEVTGLPKEFSGFTPSPNAHSQSAVLEEMYKWGKDNNKIDEAKFPTKEAWIYQTFGYHVAINTEIYKDDKQVTEPSKDPKFRQQLNDFKKKSQDDIEKAIKEDSEGHVTIDLGKGYTMKFNWDEISTDGKNVNMDLLMEKLFGAGGGDSALKDTIVASITAALTELPNLIANIKADGIESLAAAMKQLADAAQLLQNTQWGTISEGINSLNNSQQQQQQNQNSDNQSTTETTNITTIVTKFEPDTAAVENAKKEISDEPVTMKIDGDERDAIDAGERTKAAINAMRAFINISTTGNATSTINSIRNALTNLTNGGRPYIANIQARVTAPKGPLTNGPAVGSAAGTLGLAKSKGTLMGELGPELVVSKGRYFVVGQSGPEMVDLADDAIVFNHLQTQSLLTKGMSRERGHAVTNERNAVSFATGNVDGGPAMASASAALAALKQLRAMWESLRNASVSDLAGAGGGGGGGGGKDKIVDPKAWVKTVERWYNLTQEIAKLEKDITHEETLRSKLQSDFSKNGKHYYNSQRLSLKALREQVAAQEQLNLSRQDYYTKRIDALKNEPLGKLYTFDEQGQMHFRDDVTMNGQKGAMNFLTNLMGFDENGKANYTNEQKYNILKQYGFDEYMKYNSNGEQILLDADHSGDVTDEERETYYQQATEAWRDRMDNFASETQSLWDSIQEGENNLLELQADQNEILQEMRDNQIAVEEDVLKAIEDMRQREIDALQDERDKLEDSTGKYIEGLSDALSKEQEMYDNQQQENDLNQQRRRLAILQRSGGSAADIANLQNEINSNERSRYFDLQQQQIDAIQQASDLQLERMDNQIELMTETLEYQKEYGLLWSEVYDVMSHSAAQITSFIMNGNSEFWTKSPLGNATSANDTLFKADQWVEFRKDMTDVTTDVANLAFAANEQKKANDYKIYDSAMKKEFGSNYDSKGKYKGIFEQVYDETGDITKASAAARAEYQKDKKAEEDKKKAEEAKKPKPAPAPAPTTSTSTSTNTHPDAHLNDGRGKILRYEYEDAGNSGHKKIPVYSIAGRRPDKGKIEAHDKNKVQNNGGQKVYYCSKCGHYMYAEWQSGTAIPKKASGGFVKHGIYELGEEGTEGVLNAEQTRILRDNILSNKPNSLITLLNTYNEAYKDGISVAPQEASGQLIIENATVNMNVEQIANDYDARRAGEQALNEMMRIARKTGAANSIRR